MSKRKGGWEKKKEADKRRAADDAVVAKTPSIASFFTPAGAGNSNDNDTTASSCSDTPILGNEVVDPTLVPPGPDNVNDTVTAASSHSDPDTLTLILVNEVIDPALVPPGPGNVNVTVNAENAASVEFSADPGLWDLSSPTFRDLRNYWIGKGPSKCQNKNPRDRYEETKRQYPTQNRYLSNAMFMYTKKNGEIADLEWLIYSPATKKVYCFYCRLFCKEEERKSNKFSMDGFNDWKNKEDIMKHARTDKHTDHLRDYILLRQTSGRIDTELQRIAEESQKYWKQVLARVVETIILLCERGLPLRGSNEIIGSKSNGNFLGIMELIAKFDPFLAQHINIHSNRGSGHTSYLSKTTIEEFVLLMHNRVLKTIVEELSGAKYFSVTVDSTPDVSHLDQLTIVVRQENNYFETYVCINESMWCVHVLYMYVLMYVVAKTFLKFIYRYCMPSGPIERFLTFIHIRSHTGEDLAKYLLQYLEQNGINIQNCRGQSYDNASNMSGKYIGMQAQLKRVNPLIDWVPCAAHSLNLVGKSAADACVHAVSFFGVVQKVYVFLSASTSRWDILLNTLPKGMKVPKKRSDTRWSADAEAVDALFHGFWKFREVYIRICEMRNCRLVVVCALVVHSLITSSDLIITHA